MEFIIDLRGASCFTADDVISTEIPGCICKSHSSSSLLLLIQSIIFEHQNGPVKGFIFYPQCSLS